VVGKRDKREKNSAKKGVHMYVNAKTIPVDTTPGIGGGEDEG
jgi:hypothetical protein